MRKSLRITGLFVLFALAVMGGSLNLAAQATSKYYSIPPNALKPANWDADQRMWTSSEKVFNFSTSVGYPLDANAPIYLPQGAVIKKVTFYFTDNNSAAAGKIDFRINRQKPATGSLSSIATATTGSLAASSSRKSIDAAKIVNGKIDNLVNTYSINVKFGLGTPLLQFHGAVIVYE